MGSAVSRYPMSMPCVRIRNSFYTLNGLNQHYIYIYYKEVSYLLSYVRARTVHIIALKQAPASTLATYMHVSIL